MDPRTAENRRTYDAVAPLYDGRQSGELFDVLVEPFDRLCALLPQGRSWPIWAAGRGGISSTCGRSGSRSSVST